MVSFRQQFNEISQNSGSFSEDEKANIHPKSSVGITAGGPNRIKRLFSDQHFHWLSHGQMNSSSSAGLVKSYSVNRPQNCLTSSLSYTRSKSMERYGVSMRISNSQLYTTQGNCISSSSNFINTTSTTAYKPENINNISSNLMLNSSSVNMPNQSLNDTPQQLCYESIPESSGTYTVNSNVVANPHITNESSTNVRSLFNVSGVCENERPLLPSTYLGLNKIISHLDNDNRKSSSPDTGPNSSSEQRQSFQFAYTKRCVLIYS
ncbi:unnamed protein product [Heterobilharzia americana]|nr:unnamed protein product [Heterobilharzia americana]